MKSQTTATYTPQIFNKKSHRLDEGLLALTGFLLCWWTSHSRLRVWGTSNKTYLLEYELVRFLVEAGVPPRRRRAGARANAPIQAANGLTCFADDVALEILAPETSLHSTVDTSRVLDEKLDEALSEGGPDTGTGQARPVYCPERA